MPNLSYISKNYITIVIDSVAKESRLTEEDLRDCATEYFAEPSRTLIGFAMECSEKYAQKLLKNVLIELLINNKNT
jgi:hypothetical protein